MISEKSSCQMLNCVKLCSVHDRLFIRRGHTDIKRGDHTVSNRILAGNIDTRLKFDMVNGKTCNFFHFGFLTFK